MRKMYLSLFLFACLSMVVNAQSRQLEYLGGCISYLHRVELVPGRNFQDINGTNVDPVKHMGGKGFKAIRVFVSSDMPLTNPAGFPDNTNVDQRELNFLLDVGGISEQVNLAKRAKAAGMKVVLTLQFGQTFLTGSWHECIPNAWLNLTYTQMLAKLNEETRRMLTPFLNAGIQPDIIIVENEADSGMLYEVDNGSGGQAIRENPNTDVFSNVATGIYTIWPKCAGYFKRVILSAKALMTEKGMNNAYTRISVHTTTNAGRVRGTYDRIFNQPDINETNYVVNGVNKGVVSIIPADIRNTKLRDLVDIMGASVYPAVPASSSASDIAASLSQFNSDWGYVGSKITSFGKWTSGPYKGQYKKQGLVVEYALGSVTENVRIAAVKEFLNQVCNNYPWIIGAMWWEPEYSNNNWYGSSAELYNKVAWNPTTQTWPVFKETSTLAVWGSYGVPIPPATLVSGGTYTLSNRNSGKVLSPLWASIYDGAWVVQVTSTGTTSQQWVLTDLGNGYWTIKNVNSGKLMEIYSSSTTQGASCVQMASSGGNNQQWQIKATGSYYTIKNRNSGQLLDINMASVDENAQSVQSPSNGSYNQQWAPKLMNVSGVRSIEEVVAEDHQSIVHIYPNPLVGQQLTIEGVLENSTISICSLDGTILYRQNAEGKQLVIPMGKLQAGMYVVKVETTMGVIAEKIIKQ